MSLQALTEFGRKCTLDEKAREGLRKIGLEDIDAVINYANGLGFMVTKEDFMSFAQETKNGDELNEEQLEKISGGFADYAVVNVGAILAKLFKETQTGIQTNH